MLKNDICYKFPKSYRIVASAAQWEGFVDGATFDYYYDICDKIKYYA